MKLAELLQEEYGNNTWKAQFQQMKVYANPFHKAFSPTNEESKKLTSTIIRRLKQYHSNIEKCNKQRKLEKLIETLEREYRKGNYLDDTSSIKEILKTF